MPRAMNKMVTVSCDPEVSWLEGRNGMSKVNGVRLWAHGNGMKIFIDFLSKKGNTLRGGAAIDTKAFNLLIKEYLAANNVIIDPFPMDLPEDTK